MQVSKTKLNREIEKQIYEVFFQTLADLKRPQDVKIFCRDFFSKTELSVLAKRLAVAMYLEKGRYYDQIKEALKVSSATIASVDKMMNKHSEGFVLALKRIEAEEWATGISRAVKKFLYKLTH